MLNTVYILKLFFVSTKYFKKNIIFSFLQSQSTQDLFKIVWETCDGRHGGEDMFLQDYNIKALSGGERKKIGFDGGDC